MNIIKMKEGKMEQKRRYSNRKKRVSRNGNIQRSMNNEVHRTSVRKTTMKNKKRKLNKKKVAMVVIIFLVPIILTIKANKHDKTLETVSNENTIQTNIENEVSDNQEQEQPKVKREITDWRLTLANYENVLSEDFEVEVANIDETRQFDARAIDDLTKMMNDMRNDGISNIWIQSAYRSVKRQKELYDNSVQKYLDEGKTQEEAEKLTDEYINKPGSSDHNLGLAVDFNYVDNKFEDLDGFKWLQENAEKYGFILRYPKDKEDITKISYESWHWRYVGEEHAKKINELNMCLEEYIEYLQYEDTE